jgi:hypothetical protein
MVSFEDFEKKIIHTKIKQTKIFKSAEKRQKRLSELRNK